MPETIALYLMFSLLAASIVTDLRVGKIFNLVTVPCALAGLALGAMAGGLMGAGDRLLKVVMVFIITMLLSPLSKLGGGDVKLLMAVGALQGVHFTLWALLFTGVAGGLLALVAAARRRLVKQTAVNMMTNMVSLSAGVPTDLAAGSALGKIQYSLAIALGALAAWAIGA
ncbi:MAG: A24 family peptidase [Armatimonadota bacterium]